MKKRIAAAVLCTAFALALPSCRRVSEEPAENTAETTDNYSSPAGEFVSPVYASLSEEEQQVYDKIYDAVSGFKDTVSFDPPISRDTASKIYRLVYSQERSCFWLSNLFYAPEREISVLRIHYLYGREDAEIKRAELDLALSTIIGELPGGASDFDKIVYFHDTIAANCAFSDTEEHVKSAYGVLVTGYGQCEGYAAAMSALCDKAGIPNYTAFGETKEGVSHAWNKVLLNGNWYNVDCTWDDPILSRNDPDFVRHDYLLVKDSEIEGKTHFSDGLCSGLTSCESGELNYFAGKGLVFDTASDGTKALTEQIKAAGLAGKREAEIRLSSDDAYFAAMARLFDSKEIKNIIEDINGNFGTHIRSAYKHNNDDMHIIHISLIYESDPE
ncbi:MAG: hypothetical protein NC395_04835 [Prevotella sp.]|nr:hypothetical protein [Prevotella sp.]